MRPTSRRPPAAPPATGPPPITQSPNTAAARDAIDGSCVFIPAGGPGVVSSVPRMRRNWLPALVCFVLGLPWVWIGLYWAVSQHRTNRDALPVRASVVDSKVTVTREYDSKSKK